MLRRGRLPVLMLSSWLFGCGIDRNGRSEALDAGAREQPDDDAGSEPLAKVSDSLPCAIADIVTSHCVSCHGQRPSAGFSLLTATDFRAASRSNAAKAVFESAQLRIHDSDPGKRMPPPSATALATHELTTLGNWLHSGAPSRTTASCTSGQDAGSPTDGSAPVDELNGASTTPIDYGDPFLECYDLTAFGLLDSKKPYEVPVSPDLYVNFNFKAPWSGTRYLRSIEAITDNAQAIHHWILFKKSAPVSFNSVDVNVLGIHPDGVMLHGWAPGGDAMYLGRDVGQKLEANVGIQLEAHYNNTQGAGVLDASGARVCVTKTPPKHEAALSWLGTDSISGTTASGRCIPSSTQPIRLLAGQPHMHKKGSHMKVVVQRATGESEVIHDRDFAFAYQRSYLLDVTILPGDKITTTCTYSAPATFGKGTNEEMCYFFALHTPALALVSSGISTFLHGANTCM